MVHDSFNMEWMLVYSSKFFLDFVDSSVSDAILSLSIV